MHTMSPRLLFLVGVVFCLHDCSQVSGFAPIIRWPPSTSRSCSSKGCAASLPTAGDRRQVPWSIGMRRPQRETAHMMARSNSFRPSGESKRQARVSQLMATELAEILRLGHGIKTKDKIADSTRSKISIADVIMSPDLRSAKVFVSVYGDVLEKREAYAWCVKNTRAIRSALATNLRGMKRVPELYFKDTDIGAAVDLMALIDRVGEEDDAAAAARESSDTASYSGSSSGEYSEDDYTFDFDDEDDGDYDDEIAGFEGLSEKDFFLFDNMDDDK